jgi:lactate dehydrogenase-like 2-hydroxyacid dehydrogenase
MPFSKLFARRLWLLLALGFVLPAYSSEPDADAFALIDALQLNQAPSPIRESASWKKPEKVVVYLPENRKLLRKDFASWLQTAASDAKLIIVETREAMNPKAYFINIGRGKSVVTEALMNALENENIAGAGLDVTDPEPLPADHPLWRFPNVIISFHTCSSG